MMRVNIVTIFPEYFAAPLETSILGRAARAGLAGYRVIDLRDPHPRCPPHCRR